MSFLRVFLGLFLAAVGLGAVLVTIFFLMFALGAPGRATLVVLLVVAFVALIVIAGVVFAFKKVMGPTSRDDGGA